MYGKIKHLSNVSRMTILSVFFLLLKCRILHGATYSNVLDFRMWELSDRKRRSILTFHRQKKLSDLLNRKATQEDIEVIVNKKLFNKAFSNFIHRDWIETKTADRLQIAEFIARNDRFLVKPVVSSQGKGIRLIEKDKITDWDTEIQNWIDSDVILESFIKQHPQMSEINPTSVNTCRIITASSKGKVEIIGAGLRCGGKGAFVDNYSAGGCAYPIDIETGIITRGGYSHNGKLILFHPSTGKLMPGFKIPNWELAMQQIEIASKVLPRIGYVAWDVAITPKGIDIIEANINYPGTVVIQLDSFQSLNRLKNFVRENIS